MLENILTSILIFLGLYAGLLIGWMAKEELKDGKKYLIILQKFIFILTVFLFSFYFNWWIIGLVLLVILSIALFKLKKDYHRWLYYCLAILWFFSFHNADALLIIPAMTFFYGIVTGSIFYYHAKKKKLFSLLIDLLKEYYWFLIISIVLFLIQNFL